MVCGPKLQLCWMMFSVWGIIFTVILGGLFKLHSFGLFPDLGKIGPTTNETKHLPFSEALHDFYERVENRYDQVAYNCWIASALYLGTFILAFIRFQMVKNRL